MIDMENENEQMLKIDFAFTDEFGQESRLTKTFTDAVLEHGSYLEFLVDEFKHFMLGAGFSQKTVDKIQIVEEK